MSKHASVAVVILAAAVLAGCGESRKLLGLDREGPDAFSVYSRAPLTLPPGYSLRPPVPGAARPLIQQPRENARKALFGDRALPDREMPAGSSSGVQALLRATGAKDTDPNIRSIINAETSRLVKEDNEVTDHILFFKTPTEYGTVVDPAKEAKRIQKNKALGRPITEGNTPVIERRRRGLLEGLID